MRLTKIYTRSGDQGKTRLANGDEVSKDSLRVSAYGDVDELNSIIGLVLTQDPDIKLVQILSHIQHTLFDLGGELASAGMITDLVTQQHILDLEQHIDDLNVELPALEEFILPGGTKSAATLHLARTVCRRAERVIIALAQSDDVAPEIIKYMNRLSDLLFVMARFENHRSGNQEVYWKNPKKK
ncbi:MAG: cob(I)yrinic acid a,c-diamide adenosyltransferase [Candidatus Marinimicrobia bacterium]|jgi:cob(I)alamin adenosyltransferase|nr:cob(I)yrinic acid a,c-diamide adenosyltransferase [Candidatus Neomarinimicrobiota bacterium]MBT3631972.1 cob(I)yrinic acid a,c-diamide adenosyltransferase [Candidatus Neomarinimicrobiota bacterium]MBT3824558.1 cob(I)yrinic acid a,c-diamide adenosyltransferase [Candidatus Neomarinimicrobiota bacterium]MBT4130267.1 cob(I)yrinic acid a,c-diamide adenosyltransferase [Candidatus Neomarinimicrobiota bacterium]MBT4297018.1 cob(I)yrinic acid a,c-diamide adenosyltransferase [Candidatus Neomarinimicro